MKLIDLLVKELPKRGGWPEGAARLAQDPDGDIQMLSNRHAYHSPAGWTGDGRDDFYGQYAARKIEPLSSDHTTAIVTSAKYESALAASEGWIDWGGGECPVEEGTLVDVRYRDGQELSALPANDLAESARDASHEFWRNDGKQNDIIAYRLHKPGIKSRANDDRLEQDLNECIGQDVDVPEWNGEGLPPAGCKCEVMESNPRSAFDKWTPCTVIHFNLREGRETQACIIDNNGDFAILYGNDGVKFRPLRTEAERAREKLAASLHIAAGASPIELNCIGPLYFKLADAIISGSVFGTTFKENK